MPRLRPKHHHPAQEPWTYAYGKKSPTRNKELSVALGLQHVSLNTLVPV